MQDLSDRDEGAGRLYLRKEGGADRMASACAIRTNRVRLLLNSGQEDLRSCKEFDVWQLSFNPDAFETPLCSAIAFERQEILVGEVHSELIKIGLEGNRSAGAEIIGFSACFFGKPAEVRLPTKGEEESARPVPGIGSVDGPDVDVLLLRALKCRIHIRTRREISPEVVDPRRDKQNGAPIRRRRPPLHQVQKREIRA